MCLVPGVCLAYGVGLVTVLVGSSRQVKLAICGKNCAAANRPNKTLQYRSNAVLSAREVSLLPGLEDFDYFYVELD